jgi:myo-inositol-1-phosphate synthase
MRLSVEDSPNSAGVAVDMIRCAKLARDRGIAGVLLAPSAFLCKHPPVQMAEHDAFRQTEQFIDFPST